MPKWLKCIVPCLKNTKPESTDEPKKENLTDFENIDDKINDHHASTDQPEDNTIIKIENDKGDIKPIDENLCNNINDSKEANDNEDNNKITEIIINDQNSSDSDDNIEEKLTELQQKNKETKLEDNIRKHIACTLHESLSDFNHGKITHTSLKPRTQSRNNNKDHPHNTLVFQTVMLNGEPCTTRYKTTEKVEHILEKEKINSDKSDKKLAEEIRGSEIKLVFSHEVLEYLTKSFLHNKDNDLNRTKTGANDSVVCTLFPRYINPSDERNNCDMEVDTNIHISEEININKNIGNSETQSNSMDIDEISNFTDNSSSTLQTENENIFGDNQLCPRSEYQLTPTGTNQMINISSSISKSSPHMQQQVNNMNVSNKEMTRLRRNISKRVSWKENVEVCFFNHSSKSANEILQEEQPLIDHEVYWKECVGEMDRKRHEVWLKVRADEQRCLTGDGQFHDYFAYRTHHFIEDELVK